MTISKSNEPFSTGMKVVIKEKGLKQAHVAKKAGFTPQELSDMLNGRRLIKACEIPRIAEALGVSVNDVYSAGEKGEW